MQQIYRYAPMMISLSMLISCTPEISRYDATGTFEATEIIVSAELTGKIIAFAAEEGDRLIQGDTTLIIDATNIDLQKEALLAKIEAVKLKQNTATPQVQVLNSQLEAAKSNIETLQTQLDVARKEQIRVTAMHKDEAATQQQLDQVNGQVNVLDAKIKTALRQREVVETQIKAARSTVNVQNRGITSEIKPLEKNMDLLDDQRDKSHVTSPRNGTMLTKYAYAGEFTTMGKPLYKIANLDTMYLRAYIDGSQLSEVALGDQVEVFIDQGADKYVNYAGIITWIASEAEFTPKTIQTKDERTNLVYAIKVSVPNDGYLKIGMYGELDLPNREES